MKSFRSFAEFISLKPSFAASMFAAAALFGSVANADTRGEQLYRNCVICHGPDGQGIPLQLAPALTGLSEKYLVEQLKKYKSGIRGAHPEDKAGLRMLPMSQTLLTEEDMQAVSRYIVSLGSKKVPATLEGGDPVKGQALYATCLACHGPDGKGIEATGAPNLTNQHDWYLLTQMKHFKTKIRGYDPSDVGGMQMYPMMQLLADEQAMKDVLAYIQTLSN